MTYFEYQKEVFERLLNQHRADKNYTFSVRQIASKGAETNYFIGKEQSKYFGTTFWRIPCGFPGSAQDTIDLFFFQTTDGKFKYNFEIVQTKKPHDAQNKSALNVVRKIKPLLKDAIGIFYESKPASGYEKYKLNPRKADYDDIDTMFQSINEDLKIIFPIIESEINQEKLKNKKFNAGRISENDFQDYITKLDKRFKKFNLDLGLNGLSHTAQHKDTKNYGLNTILYGPPGTGKTYKTIDIAVQIITGKEEERIKNKQTFDQLRKEGQIEFVTFHQNYSYEDFVSGLRPDIEAEFLRFRPYKGVFYEIAKRARENYQNSLSENLNERSFEEVFSEIIQPLTDKGQPVKIKMASGISFTITDVGEYSIHFSKPNGNSIHTLSIQTLEDIVEGRKQFTTGLGPYYNPLADQIKLLRKKTNKIDPVQLKKFVLIIDEINRANISKVFGELITLLEDDKRIGRDNELRVTLPNGEKDFCIPPNLYVLGTMNTADKSIALIDIALRRRFEFIGYFPDYSTIEDSEKKELLIHINKAIYSKKGSSDFLIGHAYFLNGIETHKAIKNKIIPLLMEYFSGKTEVVEDVFNGSSVTVKFNKDSFAWEISNNHS